MTRDEIRAALAPAMAVCRERGWRGTWESERRGTHWHARVKLVAIEAGIEVIKARIGSSGHADHYSEANILASAAENAVGQARDEDAIPERYRAYLESVANGGPLI